MSRTIKNKDAVLEKYIGGGLALGVAFGALADDIGLGIALGLSLGAAAGYALKKR